MHALSSALRDRVRGQYGLPEVETVHYEVVTDQPWSGFNYYEGDYRSRVAINADLPHRLEPPAAPGRARGLPRSPHRALPQGARAWSSGPPATEHTVFLVNTPECLMAEGLADLGVQASIGEGWGPWAAEILGDLGLRFDGHLAERVAAAAAPLNRVRQDAAILLHDRGADADEVARTCSAGRWSAPSAPPSRSASSPTRCGGPTSPPTSRASTCCRGGSTDRPADQPVADRFVRLLDEPLTPRAVAAELLAV